MKIAMVFAVLAFLAAHDAEARGRMVWTQENAKTCGDYNLADSENKYVARMWAWGFLSGVNFDSTKNDYLETSSHGAAESWLNNYCQEHPLDSFFMAVFKLKDELDDRVNPKKK